MPAPWMREASQIPWLVSVVLPHGEVSGQDRANHMGHVGVLWQGPAREKGGHSQPGQGLVSGRTGEAFKNSAMKRRKFLKLTHWTSTVQPFDACVKSGRDGAKLVDIDLLFDPPGPVKSGVLPETISPGRVFCSLSAGSLVGKNPAAQIWSPRNLGLCRRLRSGGTATQRTKGGPSFSAQNLSAGTL